jgi:DNA end-binding protein Ku
MPASLWSGNLRLSLVLIPVKLHSAISTEEAITFRMIHEPSGQPIRNVKGVRYGEDFAEVPEEEIVKGYEHAKGHHVLIHPRELDELKLEAKHTIDMVRFVDEAEIDLRYWEKPYYLMPDGDEVDEAYTVIRDALKQTRKVAIGQLITNGRGHLIGIKAHGKGLLLAILRYAHEVRDADSYFEGLTAEPAKEAVKLAVELIKRQSGKFEPEAMPDEYNVALQELIRSKIENRAPEISSTPTGKESTAVVNIMAALKESMQAKGRAKLREAVGKRNGNAVRKATRVRSLAPKSRPARTAH